MRYALQPSMVRDAIILFVHITKLKAPFAQNIGALRSTTIYGA
ncbi:MAG: hypothetical protein VKN72_08080 [Nostocales cyanobacterium 94392]|nr:hypothetical protein [Nostocales cyanobacterium 94392]